MYKRISIIVATFAALIGIGFGTVSVPASASTVSHSFYTPTNRAHPQIVQTTVAYKTYVVKSGNTLSGIAGKFDLNWKKLYCANRKVIGKQPSLIRPKMRLKIRESDRVWCKIPSQVVAKTTLNTTAVQVGTSYTVSTSGYGSFQQCVIMRESGGNPSALNPYSGAGGLYQFLPSTWAALGFPGLPNLAPVWMQNEAFAKEYALSGTSAWAPYDGC